MTPKQTIVAFLLTLFLLDGCAMTSAPTSVQAQKPPFSFPKETFAGEANDFCADTNQDGRSDRTGAPYQYCLSWFAVQRSKHGYATNKPASKAPSSKTQIANASSKTCRASSSGAAPLTILGINMAMSWQEAYNILSTRGFTCITTGPPSVDCKKGSADVTFLNSDISLFAHNKSGCLAILNFNCDAINLCDYSYREQGQALVNHFNGLDTLQYGPLFPNASDPLLADKFGHCGRGPAGDRICIQENEFPGIGKGTSFFLLEGTFRKEKPTFD